MKKGTTINLGDSAQTTPREASLDPSKDNLNALKNAHLTPAAIRRVQAGKSINPPEKPEESTTPAQKTKSKPKPSPKPSVSTSKAPKPEPKSKPTRRQKQRALRAIKRKETKKVTMPKANPRIERTEADIIIDSWFTNMRSNYGM